MKGFPSVIGLQQEEALELLQKAATLIPVRVRQTKPPKQRYQGEPSGWRVIGQRQQGDGMEVIVTPEWLPFKQSSL